MSTEVQPVDEDAAIKAAFVMWPWSTFISLMHERGYTNISVIKASEDNYHVREKMLGCRTYTIIEYTKTGSSGFPERKTSIVAEERWVPKELYEAVSERVYGSLYEEYKGEPYKVKILRQQSNIAKNNLVKELVLKEIPLADWRNGL
jgi:hypothetical protein